jgi:hypothetical protein
MSIVPTRFDIRDPSARRRKFPSVFVIWRSTEMKKILTTAFVVLVTSTPLAFAATSANNTEPGSRHCTYQGENYDLCHQDRHKHGGEHASGASHGHRH